MSTRDFSLLASFGAVDDTDPEHVTNATTDRTPEALRDYLPNSVEKFKITQVFNKAEDFVFQKLTGQWHQNMIDVAKNLKMRYETLGRPPTNTEGHYFIVDHNVDQTGITFGPEGDIWRIKSWAVFAISHSNRPRDGLFIDKITWEAVTNKTLKDFQSIHQWRIY